MSRLARINEPGRRWPRCGLSQPDLTSRLVGISLLKLYSNEATGLGPRPLRCGDAVTGEAGNGNQSTRLEYKSTPLLIGDQAYIMPATVHTCHLNRIDLPNKLRISKGN
jgi:hypothetical protein